MDDLFCDSKGKRLSISDVAQEVREFIATEPERKYKITVGTDSALLSSGDADFVTAIVVHRIGNGGRYFWRRAKIGKFHTLRDRIIREVMISLEVAQDALKALSEADPRSWEFEVHIDVGENGPTKPMIQEVVGMVRAYNFEARTKPQSYAATAVADRHV